MYVGLLLQLNIGVAVQYPVSRILNLWTCSTQGADYPGILPCERSKALLGRKLTPEENCTRGTLVTGLTNQDIMLLDVFEGHVRLLSLVLIFFVENNNLVVPRFAAGCYLNRNTFARRCTYML